MDPTEQIMIYDQTMIFKYTKLYKKCYKQCVNTFTPDQRFKRYHHISYTCKNKCMNKEE